VADEEGAELSGEAYGPCNTHPTRTSRLERLLPRDAPRAAAVGGPSRRPDDVDGDEPHLHPRGHRAETGQTNSVETWGVRVRARGRHQLPSPALAHLREEVEIVGVALVQQQAQEVAARLDVDALELARLDNGRMRWYT
jgi:hypothetical protein